MILLVVSEPNNFHVYLQDFSTIDENSATSSKARAVSVDSTAGSIVANVSDSDER